MNEKFTYYKLNYSKYIVIIKKGNFFISFDNDALILSNIFNYKIIQSNNNFKVGFPVNSLSKIIMKLDSLKLNYIVVDKDIIEKNKFKDNTYDEYLNNIMNNRIYLNRINEINKKLSRNINNPNIKDIIFNIEKLLCKISY